MSKKKEKFCGEQTSVGKTNLCGEKKNNKKNKCKINSLFAIFHLHSFDSILLWIKTGEIFATATALGGGLFIKPVNVVCEPSDGRILSVRICSSNNKSSQTVNIQSLHPGGLETAAAKGPFL